MKDSDGNTMIGLNVLAGGLLIPAIAFALMENSSPVPQGVIGLMFLGGMALVVINIGMKK